MPSARFDFREWIEELGRVPASRYAGTKKGSVILVANVLRNTSRGDGTNAHPGLARLAELTGLSRGTVRSALGWLEANRWIRRRPTPGRLADVFDLLPAEIPLANEAVDLADVEDEEANGDVVSLADLWKTSPDVGTTGGSSGSILRVNSDPPAGQFRPFAGQNWHAKSPKLDPKTKNESDSYLGSSREEPSGARATHAREAAPDGLLWTGDRDRWGNPRYADRLGNRLVTDAEVADAYRRRHVAGVDRRALDAVRRVRAAAGWKPGPTVTEAEVSTPPPWTAPAFDPFDSPPNPETVKWLDDEKTNVASGAHTRVEQGEGPPQKQTSESRVRPMANQPEDSCIAPEANIPEGEPF